MLRYLALVALLGCGSPRPTVEPGVARQADAEQTLTRSIDAFVTGGRTPAAYQVLADDARAIVALDPRAAADVERRLVTLALFPVESTGSADQLALTVWPTLLAPALDDHGAAAATMPRDGESASDFIDRLCLEQPSLACATVAPSLRANIVAVRAAEHAVARVKRSLAGCADCRTEGWNEIRRGWDLTARAASTQLADLEEQMPAGLRGHDVIARQ